ncbi:MAG: TetR/AcrR family transcriptional regulator [Candidatus Hydrogenedentes bacterium]|nr:TetR/AcrR family transcriptional regulator [Candidatus Hydrogenedentota bacterium]
MVTRTDRIPDEVSHANEAEKRLLASALSLFSEKGYEGTSIREIIERAGVTRPVLYYYFENKEHLFRRLVESWFAELVEDMDRVLEGVEGYRERLKILIWNVFEHAEKSPQVMRLIFHTFFAPRHQAPKLDKDALWESRFSRIMGIVNEGIACGDFEGRSPETLAMVFCGMMDMHLMTKSNRPHMELSRELGETIVDIFLDGARSRVLAGGPGSV